MAKFKSLSDVGFKRVVAQLRRWIQEMRANIDSAVIDGTSQVSGLSKVLCSLAIKIAWLA